MDHGADLLNLGNLFFLFFLCAGLIFNISIFLHKRYFDYLGFTTFLFTSSLIYKTFISRRKIQKRPRVFVERSLIDSTMFLILMNLALNLLHLYSYEADVKFFRYSEFFISGTILFLIILPKFRKFKRLLPDFFLIISMIPPVSSLYSPTYLLSGEAYFTLLCIGGLHFYLHHKRNLHSKLPHSFVWFCLFYLCVICLTFLNATNPASNLEFLGNTILALGLALFSLKISTQKKDWENILSLLVLNYLPKIAIIIALPSLSRSRGGVNVNLYAILFEFLFFVFIFEFIKDRKKFLALAFSIILAIGIYFLDSRTAIAALFLTGTFSGLILILRKKTKDSIVFALISIFYLSIYITAILYIYNQTDFSLMVRKTLWALSLKGSVQSISNFLIGTGEHGFVYLMKYVDATNLDQVKSLIDIDLNIPHMHVHNDYLSALYGSGIFLLLSILFLSFYTLFRISQNLSSEQLGLGFAFLSILIHSITEPISTSYLTGFLFWLTVFFFMSSPVPFSYQKISSTKITVILSTFIIILSLLSVSNYLGKGIIKIFYNMPNLSRIVKIDEPNLENLSISLPELDEIYKNSELKLRLFPTYTQTANLLADIYLFDFLFIKSDSEKLDRAEHYYCLAFRNKSVSVYYNSLKNLSRVKKVDKESFCKTDEVLQKKLQGFDSYHLIPDRLF